MHVNLKNMPRLRLADLLRRRKMTLKQFVDESGIQAYGAMIERCAALGVQPPTEAEYLIIVPVQVSVQQDGVVVLEPLPPPSEELPFLDRGFGAMDPEELSLDEEAPADTQKKPRKKKEVTQET